MSALTIAACVGYATSKPEGQVARWLEQLAEYHFNVLHRPGRAQCNADALSRQRCPQCGISIVAAPTLPVATMEKVAPSSTVHRPHTVDAAELARLKPAAPSLPDVLGP
ncbi:hypothetical protein T12_9046 [Trichinella patagoniensis]|uniref:Retrovirus-related Pol polyprotein from transposon n=1 Tax=Trichinella patagoniensis TaxID=990121 RepID=A0A0V0Z770_9BILA|nr:hypothetical protein T12_9046 [Trichinella patagoniensis]